MDINSAWESFCDDEFDFEEVYSKKHLTKPKQVISRSTSDSSIAINPSKPKESSIDNSPYKCSELYISTKTKITYLNKPINIKKVFWEIPIIPYYLPQVGIIKKEIKFNSSSQEEVYEILEKVKSYDYVENHIISQVNNPEGRIKFKDIRKVSIGLCKKDICSYRCKRKSAFYNCFVLRMRIYHEDSYKEMHVKVFNTGKLEIPGIQNDEVLEKVLDLLVETLSPIVDAPANNNVNTKSDTLPNNENDNAQTNNALANNEPLSCMREGKETVLINSDFKCGYYVNRDNLYHVLKYKYKINCNYDPCKYPGIQCVFYYDSRAEKQNGMMPSDYVCNKKLKKTQQVVENANFTLVSFMIFRTGSVLIVGKCSEDVLYSIYGFLKQMFETEYENILGNCDDDNDIYKEITSSIPIQAIKKNKKKIVIVN